MKIQKFNIDGKVTEKDIRNFFESSGCTNIKIEMVDILNYKVSFNPPKPSEFINTQNIIITQKDIGKK
jgi:hypothetical protein